MNVYDFDKTIYQKDSTAEFYKFCLKKYPSVYRGVPEVLLYGLGFVLNIVEKKEFKSRLFKFFTMLPDAKRAVSEFWDENLRDIKQFYLKNQKNDDIIISASPRIILEEACNRLGISRLICTETDFNTGRIIGENCYGEEKVFRFEKAGFKKEDIDEFYSDSLSDSPVARLAKRAYLVDGENLTEWKSFK